jgi:hypothetical protein
MIKRSKTPAYIHLFARPSFLRGWARIADPLGVLNNYNVSVSEDEADCDAARSDWKAVGQDLWYAVREHDKTRT